MILILKPGTPQQQMEALNERLRWMGLRAYPREHRGRLALAVVSGEDASVQPDLFSELPCVDSVLPFTKPFKLAGREARKEATRITVGELEIGGGTPVVMAGPCAVESSAQVEEIAGVVKEAGASIIRGGAFKPRTSPYSFQGLGEEGLKYLEAAAVRYGLLSISEVISIETLPVVARYADILQIGARNMQNFALLKAAGQMKKPVLLKRGFSATYMDLLMAAEYILNEGNDRIILCERGIRTFESYTRNTLDIAAVPVMHELTHLPIIVDPSHGTGLRKFVAPMARAAVAAGADGLMIEIHQNPEEALSDGPQSLTLDQFRSLMKTIGELAEILAGERLPA